MSDPNYIRQRNEFFALSDFKKFVYPIMEERRDDLLMTLIKNGGEENRLRILEIDRLFEEFENVGTNKSSAA